MTTNQSSPEPGEENITRGSRLVMLRYRDRHDHEKGDQGTRSATISTAPPETITENSNTQQLEHVAPVIYNGLTAKTSRTSSPDDHVSSTAIARYYSSEDPDDLKSSPPLDTRISTGEIYSVHPAVVNTTANGLNNLEIPVTASSDHSPSDSPKKPSSVPANEVPELDPIQLEISRKAVQKIEGLYSLRLDQEEEWLESASDISGLLNELRNQWLILDKQRKHLLRHSRQANGNPATSSKDLRRSKRQKLD